MTNLHRLMVFTDLDGTLIDHVTYRWDAAQQALTALQRLSAAVVLASSNTAAEIGALRSDLELEDWPAIVEKGAGILSPHGKCVPQAAHYQAVRSVLDGLPGPLRRCFRGFGDMTADQLVEMTGLALPQAKLAQHHLMRSQLNPDNQNHPICALLTKDYGYPCRVSMVSHLHLILVRYGHNH